MRRGYSQNIRAEAITKRYRGKPWSEIQSAICEKFGVRPSIRQMQKWFEDYRGTANDPTGAAYIAKVVEESADLAKQLAQVQMMSDVMPIWFLLQEQPYDLSVFDAGLVAMWYFFEKQFGREEIDSTYSLYQGIRDKLQLSV
ncbi:MAG: hypothetical protein DDT32_01656 [Syntrophomonadaceae bacterium]|nr:hypothetical protein [Bacillota bacterium]MBT9147889.1 hypothetical protein [Bacillota bacterium]